MPRYIVEVEVTQIQIYEGIWDDEADAEENFDDGDQVRMDIEDRTVTSVEEEDTNICTCGHPIDEHQTGDGPWKGFCAFSDTDGNQCKCEKPEERPEPLHYHADDPCWTNHGLGTEDDS